MKHVLQCFIRHNVVVLNKVHSICTANRRPKKVTFFRIILLQYKMNNIQITEFITFTWCESHHRVTPCSHIRLGSYFSHLYFAVNGFEHFWTNERTESARLFDLQQVFFCSRNTHLAKHFSKLNKQDNHYSIQCCHKNMNEFCWKFLLLILKNIILIFYLQFFFYYFFTFSCCQFEYWVFWIKKTTVWIINKNFLNCLNVRFFNVINLIFLFWFTIWNTHFPFFL